MAIETSVARGRMAINVGTPDYESNEEQVNLVDTLANLRHYANVEGLDWEAALYQAEVNFAEEIRESREAR